MTADRAGRAEATEIAGMLEQAARCFAGGRLAEAASLCDAVLARAPDEPRARRQRGLVHVVAHEFAAARAMLEPLARQFADDADVRLALAEAIWGAETAAAALAHFEAACALAPDRPLVRLRRGQALLAAGQAAAARAVLESVVAALPDSAAALTQLGIAEAATGETARAQDRFAAACALDPADPDPAFQLGQTLHAAGRLDAAIAALREAVRRDPASALQRVALGDGLTARGRLDDAAVELREAVRLAPGWGLGWLALGRTLQRLRQTDEAIRCYRIARGLDRGLPDLDAIIGNALLETGAVAEARAHFIRSLGETRWARAAPAPPSKPTGGRLRVGVLLAPGAHNTPTRFILDPSQYDIELVFMLDGFDYPHARIAASYDVLFNAIGDPDRASDALAGATAFAQAVALPVVNPPGLIADTGRDRMAARLAALTGCHVPPTRRAATLALRAPGALDALAGTIGFPLLARPIGSHGGDDLVKLDSPAALEAHVAGTAAEALYLTRFHDFRSTDGHYRKYRFIIVAGEIFPYHLAIGDHWLVHYFRTGMAARPALLDEEARFLADPFGSLGPGIATALTAIARTVALDFFGVDCSIDANGKLLVFECNASMLVHNADPSPIFDIKHTPAGRIRQAVERLLARRGRRLDPAAPTGFP